MRLMAAGVTFVFLFCGIPANAAFESDGGGLPRTPELETPCRVELTLLISDSPAAQVRTTQNWTRVFQKTGRAVRFEPQRPGRTAGIRQRGQFVQVVGVLKRDGSLEIDGRRYRLSDEAELEGWLEKLARYGAAGPIRQRPTWGLSEDEYGHVLKLLSGPVGQDVPLTGMADALQAMPLPSELTVTWSPEAARRAFRAVAGSERLDVGMLSCGSGLAVILARFGCGFRPLKHPDRGLFLEIDVGTEADNFWPVGWKPQQPLAQAAPAMLKPVHVDLDDSELESVIFAVADHTQMPCFVSRQSLENAGIEIGRLRTSRRPGRLSPWRLLRLLNSRHGLGISVRMDESGQPFLWCTTSEEHRAWSKRFGSVRLQQAGDR